MERRKFALQDGVVSISIYGSSQWYVYFGLGFLGVNFLHEVEKLRHNKCICSTQAEEAKPTSQGSYTAWGLPRSNAILPSKKRQIGKYWWIHPCFTSRLAPAGYVPPRLSHPVNKLTTVSSQQHEPITTCSEVHDNNSHTVPRSCITTSHKTGAIRCTWHEKNLIWK